MGKQIMCKRKVVWDLLKAEALRPRGNPNRNAAPKTPFIPNLAFCARQQPRPAPVDNEAERWGDEQLRWGLSQRSLLRWHDDKAAGRSKLTPNLKMFGG
jgi:hypothetical protein